MNKILTQTIECIGRVHTYGGRTDVVFTPSETALFTSLGSIKTGLEAAAAQQSSGNRGFRESSDERVAAAVAARRDLRDIAEVAKALHARGIDVGAREAFRMPPNGSYAQLAAHVRSFSDLVEPRVALYTARGLPATLVEDLNARVTALGNAGSSTATERAKQVGGTAAMEELADAGMDIVRELRSIMRTKLRSTPGMLAEWNSLARVHRGSGSGETDPVTPPPSGSGTDSGTGA